MPRRDPMLTTAQAAELVGRTPAGFRRAVADDAELRAARVMADGRTPTYPRSAVLAWRKRTEKRAPRRPRAEVAP